MVRRPPAAQRGIALVMALWLTVLLTVIASGFAFSMRSEAIAARNAISLAQARAMADGAVERTLYELSRPRLPDAWAPDGRPHAWTDNGVQIRVTAVDETSKIDLNSANEALLKGLMTQVGQLDADARGAHRRRDPRLARRRRPAPPERRRGRPITLPRTSSTGPATRRSCRSASSAACWASRRSSGIACRAA